MKIGKGIWVFVFILGILALAGINNVSATATCSSTFYSGYSGTGTSHYLSSGVTQSSCLSTCQSYNGARIESCVYIVAPQICYGYEGPRTYTGDTNYRASSCTPDPAADGVVCSTNSDCASNNCRKGISTSTYYCAASGKECSAYGSSGYDTGQTSGSWICSGTDLSNSCTASAICDSFAGHYCQGSNGVWASGDGTTFVCDATNTCANQYQYYQGKYCDGTYGTGGSCSTNYGLTAVTTGDVCQSGGSVNPSANTNCGTGAQSCKCDATINCVSGSCSAARYYRGFTSTGSCTDTGRVAYSNYYPPASNSISQTTYKVGTSCTYSTAWCSNSNTCSGSKYYDGAQCNGAGSCSNYVSELGSQYDTTACTCYGGSWAANVLTSPTGANNILIQTATGTGVFRLETTGNFGNSGSITSGQATLSPPSNSFVLKNSAGTPIFYIDSSGNLVAHGTIYQKQSSISYASDNSFYVKRASDNAYVFKVDSSGNVYTIGQQAGCSV